MSFKKGFLAKEGKHFQKWRDRWFVLTDSALHYYTGKNEKTQKGMISLDSCMCRPSTRTTPSFCFEVVTPKRTFFMASTTQEEFDEWIQAIRTAARACSGCSQRAHANRCVFERRAKDVGDTTEAVEEEEVMEAENAVRVYAAPPPDDSIRLSSKEKRPVPEDPLTPDARRSRPFRERQHYRYSQLRRRPLPEDVDAERLEDFLNDEEFCQVFKVPSRSHFATLPDWRRLELKQDVGLV